MNTRKGLGIFLGVVCALAVVLGFTGCADDDDGGDINGTWTSVSSNGTDTFIVNGNTFSYAYVDNGNPSYNSGYNGTIENSSSRTGTSGSLTIHVTSSHGYAPQVGKWTVYRWKDLTSTTVRAAAPYNEDDAAESSSGKANQADAESTFTEPKGYYDWANAGAYTKQ